jgi:hypothetical protein
MRTLAVLASLLLALPLDALEVSGVQVPETISVEGKALKLNGAGVRKKAVFKVYVAALYLENPSKDAATVTSSEQVKSMRLHVLRSLKGAQITEAIAEGFQRNSQAKMADLKPRLDEFNAMFPDVTEGDEIVMTYVPGKGTTVSVKGAEKGTIEGKDFGDALFAVWLGADPVQGSLKTELLRG